MCARRLTTEALARGAGDNITVVVAFLRPLASLEEVFGAGGQARGCPCAHVRACVCGGGLRRGPLGAQLSACVCLECGPRGTTSAVHLPVAGLCPLMSQNRVPCGVRACVNTNPQDICIRLTEV